MFFCGNHKQTRGFLREYGYIPKILSESQLNRRLHAFDESFWKHLLYRLSQSLLLFTKIVMSMRSIASLLALVTHLESLEQKFFKEKNITDITQASSDIFSESKSMY